MKKQTSPLLAPLKNHKNKLQHSWSRNPLAETNFAKPVQRPIGRKQKSQNWSNDPFAVNKCCIVGSGRVMEWTFSSYPGKNTLSAYLKFSIFVPIQEKHLFCIFHFCAYPRINTFLPIEEYSFFVPIPE